MDRAPTSLGALVGGGIQVESILILPGLLILPYPSSSRIEIYPKPTYPFYPILPSANWWGTLQIE